MKSGACENVLKTQKDSIIMSMLFFIFLGWWNCQNSTSVERIIVTYSNSQAIKSFNIVKNPLEIAAIKGHFLSYLIGT
jgi:hypothetical protein